MEVGVGVGGLPLKRSFPFTEPWLWLSKLMPSGESEIIWVVATQRFFIFTPNLGEDSYFDEHIFQMGWNHQLVIVLTNISQKNITHLDYLDVFWWWFLYGLYHGKSPSNHHLAEYTSEVKQLTPENDGKGRQAFPFEMVPFRWHVHFRKGVVFVCFFQASNMQIPGRG